MGFGHEVVSVNKDNGIIKKIKTIHSVSAKIGSENLLYNSLHHPSSWTIQGEISD